MDIKPDQNQINQLNLKDSLRRIDPSLNDAKAFNVAK